MNEISIQIGHAEALKLLSEKIILWYESIVSVIPNIVIALLTMIFFIFLAKLVRVLARKAFARTYYNVAVKELMLSIAHITVVLFGCFISLEILHLEKTVTSLLAGAGVIGLALGFAFQEIASNFVSGVFIAFRKPYELGDIVSINGLKVKFLKLR